jgi:hypothetical protein
MVNGLKSNPISVIAVQILVFDIKIVFEGLEGIGNGEWGIVKCQTP